MDSYECRQSKAFDVLELGGLAHGSLVGSQAGACKSPCTIITYMYLTLDLHVCSTAINVKCTPKFGGFDWIHHFTLSFR